MLYLIAMQMFYSETDLHHNTTMNSTRFNYHLVFSITYDYEIHFFFSSFQCARMCQINDEILSEPQSRMCVSDFFRAK